MNVPQLWALVASALGINAFYGLHPTIGSLFGIAAQDEISSSAPAG